MGLLIDCGNTRCKLSRLLADGSLSPVLALAHNQPDFISQLKVQIESDRKDNHCYFSSVANPEITARIESTLVSAGYSVSRVKTQAQALGVKIAYSNPQQLGVDRFLALLAAHQIRQSVLIVSVGSALTVDILQANGQHLGGLITATENIIHDAMEAKFANFRNLSGQPRGFSDNTADALASGARYMVLGIIEKCWREASQMLNESGLPIIISGGAAEALLQHLPDNTRYQPRLVLEGLALLAGHPENK